MKYDHTRISNAMHCVVATSRSRRMQQFSNSSFIDGVVLMLDAECADNPASVAFPVQSVPVTLLCLHDVALTTLLNWTIIANTVTMTAQSSTGLLKTLTTHDNATTREHWKGMCTGKGCTPLQATESSK